MKEPLVFIALFCFSVLCSHVNSQAADSCSSNLNNLNVQLPFDASSFTCQTVWASQSFILRYSQTAPNVWSFVLSAPNTNAYIGIGFSPDGKMVGSSAIVGWITADGSTTMKRYLLRGQSPNLVVPDQGNLQILGNSSSIVLESSSIYMAFQLNTDRPDRRLLYAVGPAGRLPVGPGFALTEHDQKVSTTLNYASGFILGFSGIICGLVLNDRLKANVDKHRGLGIFILVLGCLQCWTIGAKTVLALCD
ncbi:hypothetical protein LguiB_000572 [Lonicera macranthoides]